MFYSEPVLVLESFSSRTRNAFLKELWHLLDSSRDKRMAQSLLEKLEHLSTSFTGREAKYKSLSKDEILDGQETMPGKEQQKRRPFMGRPNVMVCLYSYIDTPHQHCLHQV